jgi:hypothetical protein
MFPCLQSNLGIVINNALEMDFKKLCQHDGNPLFVVSMFHLILETPIYVGVLRLHMILRAQIARLL